MMGGGGMAPASTANSSKARPAGAVPGALAKGPDAGEAPPKAPTEAVPAAAVVRERDAVRRATATRASRKADGEEDPLVLARRIAAALNAPGNSPEIARGFYWMTALTEDGVILVANSFGLAYIPDNVELPKEVVMATADERIPLAKRAPWTTYPLIALQGWAAFHDTPLRAVIATTEQFGGSDPGVAKVILTAEEIPDTGKMTGQSRLHIVAPHSADLLAATPDQKLLNLLPAESANPDQGDQQCNMLWLTMLKPLSSTKNGRERAHLRAYHSYCHALANTILGQAHAATDPKDQRNTIKDWMYWTHIAHTLDGALAKTTAKAS